MNPRNVFAALAIIIVLAGGAVALHHFDTGQGNRTSSTIAAKSASD